MKRILPLLVLALGAVYLASSWRTPKNSGEFDTVGFGRLPVLLNGRIKPIDTVARTTLLAMQARQRVSTPERSEPFVASPTEWLLEVVFRPDRADTFPTFKIENPELLSLIGKTGDTLRIRYDSGVKQALAFVGFLPKSHSRFSYKDLEPHLPEIDRQSQLASSSEAKGRTPFQRAVLGLREKISLYQRLKYSFVAADSADFFAEVNAFQDNLAKSVEAATARQAGKPFDEAALRAARESIDRYSALSDFTYVFPIPSPDPAKPAEWQSIGQALLRSYAERQVPYEVLTYAALGKAWRERQSEHFNETVRRYRAALVKAFPDYLKKSDLEARFNAAEPFYKSMNLYVLAFFLAIFSWLRAPDTLGRSAFYLVALAFVASTVGLVLRVVLSGYAPVTNLYSSALFVGWVAGGLCLVLEKIYRNGVGSAAAGMLGFGTLLIAHHLSMDGDKMEMMRAVLDSNFWLATHVITITVGYGATFLAGFLAIIYIARGLFTRSLDKATGDALARMVYGIVCFATLFSLIGTVLGGIWADQSWGRFWGWDPKENGALIIVLWNALILHARWGGMIKHRGLMVLAVFGNVVTAWSWFGTNLLEVGLHSYGFTSSGAHALALFMISQAIIIVIALAPLRWWRSHAAVASKV